MGQEGPERGLWPRSGPGLDRDFPTAPSPFRCPQVYEGLKPSDKYEKPLDYRYGMGARDLLRAHMYTWTPHTASGPLTVTHSVWSPYPWLLSGRVGHPEPWPSTMTATHPPTGGPCATTNGGSVNSLQKASLTKVRPCRRMSRVLPYLEALGSPANQMGTCLLSRYNLVSAPAESICHFRGRLPG